MFCIFTTRAEKRHLVQEMLTKNVEHVKMKKVRTFGIGQKYICGKEDTGMKTAEVLDQTETFETAGFDILNHVGKITQVDMPMEYGRVCLAEQVGKHAALFLDFTQELDTVEEFILWINENCKRQSIPVEMRDLYELASSEKLLPEIKRYLTAEMAVRITEAAGLEKLVSISGIRYLNSREVTGKFIGKPFEGNVLWRDLPAASGKNAPSGKRHQTTGRYQALRPFCRRKRSYCS